MNDHDEAGALERALEQLITQPGAADPRIVQLLQALAYEQRRLRADLLDLTVRYEQLSRKPAPVRAQPQPRSERPLGFWANHIPDYGTDDPLDAAAAERYLARPRITPASITLSDAERTRQPTRRQSYQHLLSDITRARKLGRHQGDQHLMSDTSTPPPIIAPHLLLLCALILLALVYLALILLP